MNKMNKDTYIIVPAYNEGPAIGKVLQRLLLQFSNVVCVNDGSTDNTAAVVAKTEAKLVSHPVNMGQGAALQTGIEYALQDPTAKYFVTFDADGQHNIADVKEMLKHIREHKVDVVLGSRFLGTTHNMPAIKKWVLKLAVKFSNWTTGLRLSDAHNGLRVFNRSVAEKLNITMPDMAHASEIIHRIAEHDFKYEEMPVVITYTDYSKGKGQSIINAVNISFDIMLQRIARK